jgi:hypothetical protein
MPVRKRKDLRRADVTDQHEPWLHGADKGCGLIPYSPMDELATLWATHSERILAEHVADYPGTRPERWWKFESPEPRRRLDGIGTPASEVLAYKPRYSFGLPVDWVDKWMVKYYGGTAVDIHGTPIGSLVPTNFKGVAIDANDPPRFESQASYLKRHGLFLAGEERRLRKADWVPETVTNYE